jgi:4,5-dihydroxyphthalate decarboxylase
VERIAAGQELRKMLLAGEIDAAVALAGLDPAQVRTVIPDAGAAVAEWHRKTGAYPINHVVVVKDALLTAYPWLADELMRLFVASRQLVDNAVAYGIAANRPAIELLMRYAAEQKLIPRAYGVNELFVPDLTEGADDGRYSPPERRDQGAGVRQTCLRSLHQWRDQQCADHQQRAL